MRNDEHRFLDDVTLEEFQGLLQRPVQAIPENAIDLIRAVKQLERRGVAPDFMVGQSAS